MIVCVSNEKRAFGRVFLWAEITAGDDGACRITRRVGKRSAPTLYHDGALPVGWVSVAHPPYITMAHYS